MIQYVFNQDEANVIINACNEIKMEEKKQNEYNIQVIRLANQILEMFDVD